MAQVSVCSKWSSMSVTALRLTPAAPNRRGGGHSWLQLPPTQRQLTNQAAGWIPAKWLESFQSLKQLCPGSPLSAGSGSQESKIRCRPVTHKRNMAFFGHTFNRIPLLLPMLCYYNCMLSIYAENVIKIY